MLITLNRLNTTKKFVNETCNGLRQNSRFLPNRPAERFNKTKYALLAHQSLGKYLKELKSGQLRIDRAKVRQYEKLDGKYLLSTSDESISAEDVALGYKQLIEVERAFRTLKSTLALRPVYHTKDERIRSHVMLCWLALLLVRGRGVGDLDDLATSLRGTAAASPWKIFA